MRTQGITEYDSNYGGNHSEFANQVVGINGHIDFLPRWRSLLRLGQSLNQLDTFYNTGVFESRFNTTRWNLSWLNQITLSDKHQLTLGTDYRVDEAESNDLDTFHPGFDTYLASSRYDVGVFTELHSQLWDNHFINASLRWDENQAFGDYVTGSIGWRYNSPWGISPFASFGNAFKAPTFNELYWPDTGFGGGNPLLKPEESETVEVGLAGQHRYLQWELRAYHTNVENLISGWPPVNVGKARIEGIEAEFSTEWAGWRPKLTMSLLEPIDTTTGLRLQRRADKSLAFDLSKNTRPGRLRHECAGKRR
ncbi:TonB-dependent receptor plug domain-containing protein [Methylocucumis oryzae]|uniref:TonB-dependent receptor plug domain-containing protein n=1 Tax=Methylocucumis oryzae TaxID=1632867 RepID=UPI000B0B7287|nr:TonB-dependent receptor [Methylocucumis oryzae]